MKVQRQHSNVNYVQLLGIQLKGLDNPNELHLKFKETIKPLIRGQINLVKFIESDKFDNVYSKI